MMLMRVFRTLLALSITLSAAPLAASASSDKPVKTVNVRFNPGTTSAIYKGNIKGYQFHSYRFHAQKGQVLNISLDKSNPNIAVSVRYLGKNSDSEFLTASDQVLPFTGHYEVRILQTRNGARKNNRLRQYAVTISIVGSGSKTAAANGAKTEDSHTNWITY
ncbi:hypothetical protein [Neisseria iguanae]|uniref:DNA breaking-rejoining protein n=1 Tax=Neisseria iguanae TaxID=90242 RepID=A0A2P7U201_9NEIS|nr:hypothetical protein [Neisseria iguanae]PSJ81002.1 hypothetical protein C7N83_02935 [Neisseria iguanae]